MDDPAVGFDALGLGPEVLKAIEEAGYDTPTPIQQQAIPIVLLGRDVLGCAQTGTGKTAAYALPTIDILAGGASKSRMPRSLILAPTRELAQQITDNVEVYGKYHSLEYALLIGGEAFGPQEKALAKDPDILVATPGRLLDLVERGLVMLRGIKVLVIDEADRMLDMGFIPDVERIVKLLPRIRQTLMFSATLGPEIMRLSNDFLINPKEVRVAPPATVAGTVTHTMVTVDERDKRRVLRKFLTEEDVQSALIFCNRKKDVGVLCDSLRRHRFNARGLHGDMVQYLRTETLNAFKEGVANLLVCSDVAGRGLDIESVSHVFNFNVPFNPEDYVHRIGRTGRAGREGRAITLVTPEEAELVPPILSLIKDEIPVVTPDGEPTELEPADRSKGRGRGRRDGRRSRGKTAEAPEKRGRGKTADTPEKRSRARSSEATPEKRSRTRSSEAVPEKRGRTRSGEATAEARPKARRRERDGRAKAQTSPAPKDEPVVGMGDHVPDFLRDPVRRPKRAPARGDREAEPLS